MFANDHPFAANSKIMAISILLLQHTKETRQQHAGQKLWLWLAYLRKIKNKLHICYVAAGDRGRWIGIEGAALMA